MPSSVAAFRLMLSATTLLLALTPGLGRAAWSNDPGQPTVIYSGTGARFPTGALPDGSGGYFLAWADQRSGNYDVWAQHFDASGNPLWTPGGVLVVTGPTDQAISPIISDGAGGIIVPWLDLGATAVIYVQRLNASGMPQWGAGGVRVATQPASVTTFSICSDGAGGALFAWEYAYAPTDHDVYAQRISAAGTRLWGIGGLGVVTSTANQDQVSGVSDGAGGMWFVWRDNRTVVSDIYVQRLNGSGVAAFTAGGINPESFVNGDVQGLSAVADGFGGVIATFSLNAYGSPEIESLHVYPSGTGISQPVTASLSGDQLNPILTTDGNGGGYVFWNDKRSDIRGDVYGMHLTSYGTLDLAWPSQGLAIATGLDVIQAVLVTMGDGQGGAILFWQEAGAFGPAIVKAKRLAPDGSRPPGWTAGGNVLFSRPSSIAYLTVASTGAGGLFCNWSYQPTTASNYDLVAQRLDGFGQIGTPEPRIVSARDVPNDQGGLVRINWDASPLETGLSPLVNGYQLWRQVPQSAALAAKRAGAEESIREIVSTTATTYWEYAGGVAAQHFAGYSMTASTTSDSIAGSNPRTLFMVEAVGSFTAPGPVVSSFYWYSNPDSAYSVDNLPPALPLAFAGTWSGGGAALTWNANSEADLAGYRLYRGGSSSFVPSPANLVASPTQSWYNDTGAGPSWYRLSAVDMHGNEGPTALLAPSGTTDAESDLPREVAFAITSRNPAREGVALRVELPSEASVDVSVFDASGREVNTLAHERMTAGRWPIVWRGDARDGTRVQAGIYFVRLRVDGNMWSRRVMLIP